jgi:hypothetical protein
VIYRTGNQVIIHKMQTGVLKHLFLNMYITISTSAAFTEKGEKYEK